jgi:hypothetical protein
MPESELIEVTPLLLVLPELLEVPELDDIPELEPAGRLDVIPVPEEPEPPVGPELEAEAPFMLTPASGRESGEPDEPQPLNKPTRAVVNTTELRMVLPPVTVMVPSRNRTRRCFSIFLGKWLFRPAKY